MNQKRVQCKEGISKAKHMGTRNTRLPKEEIEPRQNMSEKLSGAPSEN